MREAEASGREHIMGRIIRDAIRIKFQTVAVAGILPVLLLAGLVNLRANSGAANQQAQALAVELAWADSLENRDEALAAIAKRGPQIIPALREILHGDQESLKSDCLRVLDYLPPAQTRELLLEVALDRSGGEFSGQAMGRLTDWPIEHRLTEKQLGILAGMVRDPSIFIATDAAKVLSQCRRNDQPSLVPTVLARFRVEIANPVAWPPVHESYLSPRVLFLNQFLLAFANFGPAATPVLREELGKETDPEPRKWLLLGLGMSGDPAVAGQLKEILETDPDRYIRAVALRAYALSLGEAALPVLEQYLQDTTESEYYRHMGNRPWYLLRNVALGEISTIRNRRKHQERP